MKTSKKHISGYSGYTQLLARFSDLFAVACAGIFAYRVRLGDWSMSDRYGWAILTGGLLVMLIFPAFGIYQSWRGRVRALLLFRLFLAYILVGASLSVFVYFSGMSLGFSRIWVFSWIVGALFLSVLARVVTYPLINRLRAKGRNRRAVLLVGDAHSCSTAYHHLERENSVGFDVKRVLVMGGDQSNELTDIEYESYELGQFIEHDEEEVWICLPLSHGQAVREIQNALSLSTGNVRYMPDMRDFRLINHSISNVADLYLLDLSCTPMTGVNRLIKAVEDKLIAILILILISPILLFVALGVRFSSPGPIFYRQERVGWNGNPFMMLKFRSMPVDVEKEGVQWGGAKTKGTTKFGAFIRRTSLDELPQFINVLKGDMSIVGPRPERSVFVEQFKHEIPGYMQKHMVKAGITGWAQINGWRGDTDLTQRIECDLWYVENWSIFLDIKIIFLTVFKGFVSKNAY